MKAQAFFDIWEKGHPQEEDAFFDYELWDIPTTVASAIRNAPLNCAKISVCLSILGGKQRPPARRKLVEDAAQERGIEIVWVDDTARFKEFYQQMLMEEWLLEEGLTESRN